MEEDASGPDTISFLLSALTGIDPRLRDKPKDVCLETARGLKKMECVAMITRFHDNYHRTTKLAKSGTALTHFVRN